MRQTRGDDTISAQVNRPDDLGGRLFREALDEAVPGHTERAEQVSTAVTRTDPEAK